MLRVNAEAAAKVPVAPFHWDPDREKKLGLVLYRQPTDRGATPPQTEDENRFQELNDGMELDPEPMDIDQGGDMDIE